MAIYKLVKSKDNQYLLLMIGAIVVFFVFVYPKLVASEEATNENFNVALSKCHKIDQMICSPKCISSQWSVSFPMKDDPRIKDGEVGTKWIPTNYMCTGLHGRGSICINKEGYNNLQHRGGNAL
jgi:hypothetical protein